MLLFRGYWKEWFCGLLLIALLFSCRAQEPSFIHYGLDNGLPSSEVYQSIQDKEGRMWFGTDRGLVRFDGYDFKTFTTKDGLGSDVIFGFHKDLQHKIWWYSLGGGIGYLEKGKIQVPAFNRALKDTLGRMTISSMYVSENGTVYLSDKWSATRIEITPTGNIRKTTYPFEGKLNHSILVDSNFFVLNGTHDKQRRIMNLGVNPNWKGKEPDYVESGENIGKSFNVLKANSGHLFLMNNRLVDVRQAQLRQEKTLPAQGTLGLYEDQDQNIWIGLYEQGVICFSGCQLDQVKMHLLQEHSVSHIYEDTEGGFWFTTLESGIFYAPNLGILSKRYEQGNIQHRISTLWVGDSKIWLGNHLGSVIDQPRPVSNAFQILYKHPEKFRYVFESDGHLYLGVSTSNKLEHPATMQKNHHLIAANCFLKDPENDTLRFVRGKVLLNDKEVGQPLLFAPRNDALGRKFAFCKWREMYLLGGNKGIHFTLDSKLVDWQKYPLSYQPYVEAFLSTQHHLFIASRYSGVIVHSDDTTWTISEQDGLPTNYIKKIVSQNDSVFWLGSSKGVSRICVQYKNRRAEVINITKQQGLPVNQVNDLFLRNDTLWIASDYGLTFMNVHQVISGDSNPKVYLRSMTVNNGKASAIAQKKFMHTDRVFDFSYAALDYKSGGKIKYKYRLHGFNDQWEETYQTKQRYMLGPGKYQFEVLAQNYAGVWSNESARVDFEIEPPFWKELWFILLTTIFGLTVIYVFVMMKIKGLKEKNELEVQMAYSQHKALSAQLKPHFVFNALNSVNKFINDNNREESSDYLSLFSSLIRQILTNSGTPLIALDEELSQLDKYLQVEQLRFKEKLTYEINVSDEIDIRLLKVPNQLLQPYVENAIWHGIMNRSAPGHIQIDLFAQNNELHCYIEDNGVGREAARAFYKGQIRHQPAGLKINKERLALIEAIYKLAVSVQIIDLTDASNQARGTRVEIRWPQTKI